MGVISEMVSECSDVPASCWLTSAKSTHFSLLIQPHGWRHCAYRNPHEVNPPHPHRVAWVKMHYLNLSLSGKRARQRWTCESNAGTYYGYSNQLQYYVLVVRSSCYSQPYNAAP
jgi:hypothetical protein